MTDQNRQMADSSQRLATFDELLCKPVAAFQQGECDAERARRGVSPSSAP